MPERAMTRALMMLAIGVFILLIGFGFWMYQRIGSGDLMSGAFQESEQARVDIGGPFQLVDHTGRRVTEADFAQRRALNRITTLVDDPTTHGDHFLRFRSMRWLRRLPR